MGIASILENFSKITIASGLALILFAGHQGYWVFGTQYQDARLQAAQWHDIAIQALHLQASPPTPPGVVGMAPPSPLDDLRTKAKELEDKHVSGTRNPR